MVEVEAILPGEPAGTTYAQVTKPVERENGVALAQRLAREEAPVQTLLSGSTSETVLPKGVYLQLGAFGNADNAENLRNHLSRELDWLSEPMRIQSAGGIHRLQLGPYASRPDAEKIADRIRSALGYKPTFVIR